MNIVTDQHLTTPRATTGALTPGLARLRLAALAAGPWVTAPLLGAVAAPTAAAEPQLFLVLAVLLWSPLPIAVPALLLQQARDTALPQLAGPVGSTARAALLLPYLSTAARSPVRREMLVSLVSWGTFAVVHHEPVLAVIARL